MLKKVKIKKGEKFGMPGWMECTWRRVPCGKDNCPICGTIKKDREKHLARGQNPDDLGVVLDDLGNSFREIMKMIKMDAKKHGIDITNIEKIKEPPRPEKFPLYREVEKWRGNVLACAHGTENNFWTFTEEAQDLFWYTNILTTKTYRQLCNRWHLDNESDYGDYDYQYTRRVLSESLKILQKSLSELIPAGSAQKGKLMLISAGLMNLEKKILKI